MTYPPRQAKHAILKTLKFFTRAMGPEAPVNALRRARVALSTLVSGTAPIAKEVEVYVEDVDIV